MSIETVRVPAHRAPTGPVSIPTPTQRTLTAADLADLQQALRDAEANLADRRRASADDCYPPYPLELGARMVAADSGTPYLCLTPAYLRRLVAYADAHPEHDVIFLWNESSSRGPEVVATFESTAVAPGHAWWRRATAVR